MIPTYNEILVVIFSSAQTYYLINQYEIDSDNFSEARLTLDSTQYRQRAVDCNKLDFMAFRSEKIYIVISIFNKICMHANFELAS